MCFNKILSVWKQKYKIFKIYKKMFHNYLTLFHFCSLIFLFQKQIKVGIIPYSYCIGKLTRVFKLKQDIGPDIFFSHLIMQNPFFKFSP